MTVRGLDLDITGLCLQFFTPENRERVLPSLIKAIRLSNDLLNPNEKRVLNSMVARLMFLAEQNAEADNQIEKLEQQYLVENP